MDAIELPDALKIMNSWDPFYREVVSFDKKQDTGGKALTFENATCSQLFGSRGSPPDKAINIKYLKNLNRLMLFQVEIIDLKMVACSEVRQVYVGETTFSKTMTHE